MNLSNGTQFMRTGTDKDYSLIDEEGWFPPTFDIYVMPASKGTNRTLISKGSELVLYIDPSDRVYLKMRGHEARFNKALRSKIVTFTMPNSFTLVGEWNNIVVWCNNRYRRSIYCESALNLRYNGLYTFPQSITYVDRPRVPIRVGDSTGGFVGNLKHFKIAMSKAAVFIEGLIINPCSLLRLRLGCMASPFYATNSLGGYYYEEQTK